MPFYTGHLAAESNRADLAFQVEMFDPETNEIIDTTNCLIVVALRAIGQAEAPTMQGTNADGHVEIVAPNTFLVHFTRQEMGQFSPGDVDLGITIRLNDGITYQLFSGQLPIVDGVVSQ